MAGARALACFAVVAALAACAPRLEDRTSGMSVDQYDRVREGAAAGEAGAEEAGSDVDMSHPKLSDEQSFEAVSSRETIESDKARLEAQREAYRQIAPVPVPDRPSDMQPNLAAYALGSTNAVGEQEYRRFNPLGGGSRRECSNYASPAAAQRAFLASGGPQRDRNNLDPDGDGFACSWSPEPFRAAVR